MELEQMTSADYSLKVIGYTGVPEECGDAGFFIQDGRSCFISHFDALGHNSESFRTAAVAVEYVRSYYHNNLTDIIKGLHEHLQGLVGTVGFTGRLDLDSGNFEYSAIGNITARVYGYSSENLISVGGIIGYSRVSPVLGSLKIFPGDIIVLTSDGVRENFIFEDYPGLLTGNADDIAGAFISCLGKDNDDISCSVMRYLP